jgi:hypothetical protein
MRRNLALVGIGEILIHAIGLDDREQDLHQLREVPFLNASEQVFHGLRR